MLLVWSNVIFAKLQEIRKVITLAIQFWAEGNAFDGYGVYYMSINHHHHTTPLLFPSISIQIFLRMQWTCNLFHGKGLKYVKQKNAPSYWSVGSSDARICANPHHIYIGYESHTDFASKWWEYILHEPSANPVRNSYTGLDPLGFVSNTQVWTILKIRVGYIIQLSFFCYNLADLGIHPFPFLRSSANSVSLKYSFLSIIYVNSSRPSWQLLRWQKQKLWRRCSDCTRTASLRHMTRMQLWQRW